MNPGNWLDQGYDTIALNGTPLSTQRTTLNIVTGAGVTGTLADNETTLQTDLTLTAGAYAPIAALPITGNFGIASPAASASYAVVSSVGSGAITVTIEGTPVVGTRLTFFDWSKNWATYHFTCQAQSGATVQDPANLDAANAGTAVLSQSGFSVTWELVEVGGVQSWLVV
jgi:hypothetical protein